MNIRSLHKNYGHLATYLAVSSPFDVLGLTESWLTDSHLNSDYPIPGCTLLRNDRDEPSGKRGGGVCVYIKDDRCYTRHSEIEDELDIETVIISVRTESGSVIVATIYSPPSTNSQNLCRDINKLLNHRQITGKRVIFQGDFNLNWNNHVLRENLEEAMRLEAITQTVTSDTRVNERSSTCIDLVFVSDRLDYETRVIECDISDHYSTVCRIQLKTKIAKLLYRKRRFRDFDPVQFCQEAAMTPFHTVVKGHSADEAAENIENMIVALVDRHAPFKTVAARPRSLMWQTPQLLTLIREKNSLYRKLKVSKTDETSPLWQQYKKLRNHTVNMIRSAKRDAIDRVVNDGNLNDWEKLNLLRGPKKNQTRITQLETQDGPATVDQDIANTLNDYFSTIGSQINAEHQSQNDKGEPDQEGSTPGTFSLKQTTRDDVEKLLSSLCDHKKGGVQEIPGFIYKLICPLIVEPLTHIYNLAMEQNIFPACWKVGLVIPIHKGKATDRCGNYRPISLLPILGKVLERIVARQFKPHLFPLLHHRQHGFRKGTSAEGLLLQLTDKWLNNMRTEDKITCVVSLDIRKAFDSIDHGLALQKLSRRFDLSDDMMSFLKNYLSDRMQSTKANNCVSTLKQVKTGVPQGSVLGPFIFLTFVDDLLCNFQDAVLYADDCLLYASSTSASEALKKLTKSTTDVLSWYKENKLSVNIGKTEVMTLSAKPQPPKSYMPLLIEGKSIPQSDKMRYLGVVVDQKLSWVAHYKKTKQKIYPAISIFTRLRKHMNKPLATLFYQSVIRSRLEYCSSVLANGNRSNNDIITKIENRCLRIICPNKNVACNKKQNIEKLRHETGVVDIHVRIRAKLVCIIHTFVHNLSLKISQYFLTPNANALHSTRGGATFKLPVRCDGHIRAPTHKCAVLWNGLNPEMRKKKTKLKINEVLNMGLPPCDP